MIAPWGHYARYNRLANETLYEACAALFRSVHGTLNQHRVLRPNPA